jgi:hypothetical protein
MFAQLSPGECSVVLVKEAVLRIRHGKGNRFVFLHSMGFWYFWSIGNV